MDNTNNPPLDQNIQPNDTNQTSVTDSTQTEQNDDLDIFNAMFNTKKPKGLYDGVAKVFIKF